MRPCQPDRVARPSALCVGSRERNRALVLAFAFVACSEPGAETGTGGSGGLGTGTSGGSAGAPSGGASGASTGGTTAQTGGVGAATAGFAGGGAGGAAAVACFEDPFYEYGDELLAGGVDLWNLAVVSCERAGESCELDPVPGITFTFCSCLNDSGLHVTQCPNINRTFLECTGASARSANDFQCISGQVLPVRDGPCWAEFMAFSGCSEEGGGG